MNEQKIDLEAVALRNKTADRLRAAMLVASESMGSVSSSLDASHIGCYTDAEQAAIRSICDQVWSLYEEARKLAASIDAETDRQKVQAS